MYLHFKDSNEETITNTHLEYTLNADGLCNFSVDG